MEMRSRGQQVLELNGGMGGAGLEEQTPRPKGQSLLYSSFGIFAGVRGDRPTGPQISSFFK